jgi:hypothetical protein
MTRLFASLILAACLAASASASVLPPGFRVEITDHPAWYDYDPYSPITARAAGGQTRLEHLTRIGKPYIRFTNLSECDISLFAIDIAGSPNVFDIIQVSSVTPGVAWSVSSPSQDGQNGAVSPTFQMEFANGLGFMESITFWADLDGVDRPDFRETFWDDSWLRVDNFAHQFPDFTIPYGPSSGTFTDGLLNAEWVAAPVNYDPFETTAWYKMEGRACASVPEPTAFVIFIALAGCFAIFILFAAGRDNVR